MINKKINLSNNITEKVLLVYLVILAFFILGTAIYSGVLILDDVEHIHASWLVWQGKIPYRDFFEHHHALLWYLFAPITAVFYNQAIIVYVAKFLTLIVSVLTFYYFYKIMVKFVTDRMSALFALGIYFSNWPALIGVSQFRPDNYMLFMQILGIYYFFEYLETQKRRNLVISFGAFFLAFMFLQKILYFFLPMGLAGLYLLYKHKVLWTDVFWACLFPLAAAFFYLGYLYFTGSLKVYYELNWLINMLHPKLYYDKKILFFSWYIWLQVALAFVSVVLWFAKGNIYFKIFSLFFAVEFIFKKFVFCPYPQYLMPLLMAGAVLSGKLLAYLTECKKYVVWIIVVLMEILLVDMYSKYRVMANNRSLLGYEYPLLKYVLDHTKEDEYLLNGYGNVFNLYRRNIYYYWFSLERVGVLDKELFDRADEPDLNEAIKTYHPRFIYMKDYYDDFYLMKNKKVKIVHEFDKTLVEKMYKPTEFEYLYELKERY